MIKDLFFFYYLISYSAGMLALFLSMYLYFIVRTNLLKKYIRLMALFFIFISVAAVANYLPNTASYSLAKAILLFFIFAACCFMIFMLPEFMNSVYRIQYKKKADAIFLFLTAVSGVFLIVYSIQGRISELSPVLLSFIALAILYSLVHTLFLFRKNLNDSLFSFLHMVNLFAFIAFPLIIIFDLYRNVLFPSLRISGPMIFPSLYFLWNVLFIRNAVKILADKTKTVIDVPVSFFEEYGISLREREIVALLIKGNSYREIMELLFISMPTVKTHVSSIYSKTGAKSKMDLAGKIQNFNRAQHR